MDGRSIGIIRIDFYNVTARLALGSLGRSMHSIRVSCVETNVQYRHDIGIINVGRCFKEYGAGDTFGSVSSTDRMTRMNLCKHVLAKWRARSLAGKESCHRGVAFQTRTGITFDEIKGGGSGVEVFS